MEWTDETIARLRALWMDGHSTAEIGRRIGVSKNAVVGKAHRLVLPPRPSPIRRDGMGGAMPRPAACPRVIGSTLPPLSTAPPVEGLPLPPRLLDSGATMGPERGEPEPLAPAEILPVQPSPIVAVVARPAPPVRVVAAPRPRRTVACCWPLGEPGTPSFRFCDAEAAPGKPYCGEHAAVAYVKARDRREEAA